MTGTRGAYNASLTNVNGSWPDTAIQISDAGEFEVQFAPIWDVSGIDTVYKYPSTLTIQGFLNADGSVATAIVDIRLVEDPGVTEIIGPADGFGRMDCEEGVCIEGTFLRPPQ